MGHLDLPSRHLERAVEEISSLPGIGSKTALRLALHLLGKPQEVVDRLAGALVEMRRGIRHCRACGNLSDHELCPVCSSGRRDASQLCVVESFREILAIENTGQYQGLYHVLGGLISPMDGVGPSDLSVDRLLERASGPDVREVILALSTTLEGDTTNFYLHKKLSPLGLEVSTLARGLAVGDELEYADPVTLGRSIAGRVKLAP